MSTPPLLKAFVRVDQTIRVEAAGMTLARSIRRFEECGDGPSDLAAIYVPSKAVEQTRLVPSGRVTICERRGLAEMYDIVVGNLRIPDAAWQYPLPNRDCSEISGHFGFDARKVAVVAEDGA